MHRSLKNRLQTLAGNRALLLAGAALAVATLGSRRADAYTYKWTHINSPGTVPTAYIPSSLPYGGNALIGVGQNIGYCWDYPDYFIVTGNPGVIKYNYWSDSLPCTASSWLHAGAENFTGVTVGPSASLYTVWGTNGSDLWSLPEGIGYGEVEIGTGASGQGWLSPAYLISTYDNKDLLAISTSSCAGSMTKPSGNCVYKYSGDYTDTTGWGNWNDSSLGAMQITQDGAYVANDEGTGALLFVLDSSGNMWTYDGNSNTWSDNTADECGTSTTFQAAQLAVYDGSIFALQYNGGSINTGGVWGFSVLGGCWSGPLAANPSGTGNGLWSIAAPGVWDITSTAHIHPAYGTDNNGDVYYLDTCSGGC